MAPAALFLEGGEFLYRRTRDHRKCDALQNVGHFAVIRTQQRSAHWARPLALWTEHPVIGDECVVSAEHLGQRDGSGLSFETIILRHRAAERQRAALRGDAFDMAAQF